MKRFFVISAAAALFLQANTSKASTLGVFNQGQRNAIAIVRGNFSDADAQTLFNRLKTPPQLIDGFYVKELFATQKTLHLKCVMSSRYPETGTCTLQVNESEHAIISYADKKFLWRTEGSECGLFANNFYPTDPSDPNAPQDLYRSLDSKLKMEWVSAGNECRIQFKTSLP